MNPQNPRPPELCSISLCDKSLFFHPLTDWPEGLPSVAVNKVVLAGFGQDLAFNHEVPISDSERIASLFRSLYFDLSFVEISRLAMNARLIPWFPINEIITKLGWNPNELFFKISGLVCQLPFQFQQRCAEKKLNLQDFSPLASLSGKTIFPLLQKILSLQASRQEIVQALELGVELLLLGKTAEELDLSMDEAKVKFTSAVDWLVMLKALRFPLATQADQEMQSMVKELPWPLLSQAKWVRQGDKSGIEIKFTITNANDLKKKISSLNRVQEILEKDSEWTKTKH